MLTKIGNLLGLQNLKQSQLNLGVIQSLAGEVFNTDNCTIIENQHGISFRNVRGIQLCWRRMPLLPVNSASQWVFPTPFSDTSYLIGAFSDGYLSNWGHESGRQSVIPCARPVAVNFADVIPMRVIGVNLDIAAAGLYAFAVGNWKR